MEAKQIQTTVIDLLRHGEVEGGEQYRGQTDLALSPGGWMQLRSQIPVNLPWQQIVTSPLLRCADFAEDLARQSGLLLAYEPRLTERSMGEWEGRSAAELRQQNNAAVDAYYRDPVSFTPPGAEPLVAFQQRVLAAWHDLLQDHPQRHLLVVTHAGCIRVILAQVLNMPLQAIPRLAVPYAGLSRIKIRGSGESARMQLMFHAGP
ncbi:MAG: alpha-ribazole phosphatase family protein [Pseudomonadota bacterium]|nr:alpha-ribazole phosphatase family protein [Pseudomonadota bacterium]